MLKNLWGHFTNVVKHKWIVFCLCCKAGIPVRGIMHDLSKFSITEFFQGVKYYRRWKKKPNSICKRRLWLFYCLVTS